MQDINVFADNMKKRRKYLGYSQEKLANMTGLDLSCIARTERKINNPTISTIIKICDALKVDISVMTSKNYSGKDDGYAICKIVNGKFIITNIDESKIDKSIKDILDSMI